MRRLSERKGMAGKLLHMAAFLLALSSCETDYYDSGTGANSLVTADFVDALTGDTPAIGRVATDGGDTLVLTAPITPDWAEKPDTAYRAVFYYEKAGEGTVRPYSIAPMTVLRCAAADKIKEMKTDPVTFESCWTAATAKYLNLAIVLKVGSTAGANLKHGVGMVRGHDVVNADGTRTAVLTLYHDQGGVPEYYSQKYYLSVELEPLRADSVTLKVNTYGGMVERTLKARK